MSNAHKTLLPRPKLAEALTSAGFPTKTPTLAKWACLGEGPPYQRYGKYALYDFDEALAWAKARLSRQVTRYRELEDTENTAGSEIATEAA